MKIFILIVALLSSLSVQAIQQKRKTASENERIEINILYNERITRFTAEKIENKYTLSMNSNIGFEKHREIRAEDYTFLFKEYQKLPVPNKIPDACYRNKMEIIILREGAAVEKKSSCFGLNTSTEPSYVRFSNILSASL